MRIVALLSTLFIIGFASSSALAEAGSLGAGIGKLIPTLDVQVYHDDNLFSTPDQETSSTVTSLAPSVEYYVEKDELNYISVRYDGKYARYYDSRDDDYADHTVFVAGAYSGTSMVRMAADASTARLHDDRGTGASEGAGASLEGSPDEYDEKEAGVMIDVGRTEARFGMQLSARTLDIDYTNNRDITVYRDREDLTLESKFFARVSGKTRLFAGYRVNDIEYDSLTAEGSTLDSDEKAVFVGVTWEATAKTSGSIEVGREDKDFDSQLVSTGGQTIWDIGVKWKPLSYSTLSLDSSSGAGETNGTGDYIEQLTTTVSWDHTWSERLSSNVSVSIGEDEYVGDDRKDDRQEFVLGLNYEWQRWATIGLEYVGSERDSNSSLFDYDRREFYLTLNLSL